MDKLGVEPIQLLTQSINFVIMLFLLTKFLYKPILKVLDERKKKIAEGLASADKGKIEAEKTENKRQEVLAKAKEEGRKIIEEGKLAGKRLEAEIVEKAHLEATEIIEKAKKDIELERENMEKHLKNKTVEIALALVTKVLSESLTEKNQKDIIDKKLSIIAKQIK